MRLISDPESIIKLISIPPTVPEILSSPQVKRSLLVLGMAVAVVAS